jgi:hypothetical protein
MENIDSRIHKAVQEIVGNEALLQMLDADAAAEMLNWGTATATALVKETEGLDDAAAEEVLAPRLKALRQSLRSIGNWAAGKYADPESRAELRDKLIDQIRTIRGEMAKAPSSDEMDALLGQTGVLESTPYQRVLQIKQFIDDLN